MRGEVGKGTVGLEIVGVPGMELLERLKGVRGLVEEEVEFDVLGVRCKRCRA